MGAAPGLGVPGMQVAPVQANPWSAPVASATPAAVPGMSIPLPGGFKLPIKLGGASGGVSMFKILGGVVLMIALAIGGVVFKMKFAKPKGVITYKALGLEKGKADQKGRYWRAGMVILTPDDLLARADRYRRRAA